MSDAWTRYAHTLRAALTLLGVSVPLCMPEEPHACGRDAATHALSYVAALYALAEHELDHLHHGDPAIMETAEELVSWWANEFKARAQARGGYDD